MFSKVNPKQSFPDMEKNFAFIDAQNVNLGIRDQGWKLDWKKLFKHLGKMYKSKKVFLFIGYVPENQDMYTFLQGIGYILVFKPVLQLKSGKTKGNVDAELVLQVMIEIDNFDKAVIITGDGDFACLVRYLRKNSKIRAIIVPNEKRYSSFLRHEGKGLIDSLTNKRNKLEYKT